MTGFWVKFEADEAVRLAAIRERERADKEYALLDRIPEAASRMCCVLRYSADDPCAEGECIVLAGLWP